MGEALVVERDVGVLTFACSGCDASEAVPVVVTVTYDRLDTALVRVASSSPRVTELTPAGWVVCDPYTHSTYCRDCWQTIQGATSG